MERTDKVVREVTRLALSVEGTAHTAGFAGFDGATFTNTTNSAVMFLTMKNAKERAAAGRTAAVITGDATQIDLPKGVTSGLKHAARILDGVDGISFTRFAAQDVVRPVMPTECLVDRPAMMIDGRDQMNLTVFQVAAEFSTAAGGIVVPRRARRRS